MTQDPTSPEPPLCVDLDGTLIEGDTLRISLEHIARTEPWALLALPFLLLRGRPALKAWVAKRYVPDPANLIWRTEVIEFLREERGRGRKIILATAAHRLVAERVAGHLGLFDGLVATDGSANAKGMHKTAHIRKSLSCSDFDYIGDSRADLPIFQAARTCYLVAPSDALHTSAKALGRVGRIFHSRSNS